MDLSSWIVEEALCKIADRVHLFIEAIWIFSLSVSIDRNVGKHWSDSFGENMAMQLMNNGIWIKRQKNSFRFSVFFLWM